MVLKKPSPPLRTAHACGPKLPPLQLDTMHELSCAPPTALAVGAVLKLALMPPE